MSTFASSTLGAIACAAALAAAAEMASASQNQPPTATPPNRVVVIGCVQRAAPAPAGRTGSRAAEFTMRDFRAGSYRLDGDEKLLDLHTGHQVEIAGTVMAGGSGTPRLKVASLIWLSSTCWK